MHSPTTVCAFAALTALATAIDIVVYPNSVSCNDNTGGLRCSNIAQQTCCHTNNGQNIFSAKFFGLRTAGVPDYGIVFENANNLICGTSCNSDTAMNGNPCVDPDTCPAGNGATWQSGQGGRHRREVGTGSCVEPDMALFANGQKFYINYDVPANVTSVIMDLVINDSSLASGVPELIKAYEVL